MFMRFLALLSLFAFMLFLPSMAKAQGHGLYCEQADSTAATQTCLKRHLDTAQTQLNTVYKSLENLITPEKKKELEALQKTWLAYRDAECQWEAESSENPSLKRINELSCMARVTEDRANVLSVANDNVKNIDTVREYGSFPRWMNVVAKDSPDTYWQYGKRNGFDLNCDGSDDYIMMGLEPKVSEIAVSTETEEESKADIKPQNYNADIVVSITQNPATGRPVAQKIKFLIGEGEGDNVICNNDVKFKFIPAPAAKDKEEEKSCGAKLEIQAKSCPAKTIYWTGKEFALEKIEEIISKDKDNKEEK